LQDIYLPSSFSSEEYPNLVAKDTKVYALAVPTVLMVYNWPPESERYRRVARFVDALFGKIGQLQQPHVIRNGKTPDYRSASPGWNVSSRRRTGSTKPSRRQATQAGPTAATAEEFRSFLVQKNGGENVSPQDTSKAYNDFLRWRAGQR
jgi:hypothetical protein